MPIEDFYVTAVTILNPTHSTDRNGNTVDVWTSPATTETVGWLQDLGASETRTTGDTVVSTHQLFCAATEPISAFSRLVIDANTFEVEGAPNTARTPSGAHHLEVQLRLVDDIHQGSLA